MRIEARYLDQTYDIEIREQNGQFEVCVGEGVFPVQVLACGPGRWTLEINGEVHDVLVAEEEDHTLIAWQNRTFPIHVYSLKDRLLQQSSELELPGLVSVKAQMPGKVISVLAQEQDPISAGQGLVVIEAMKMQNELKSPKQGRVITCNVKEGTTVGAGELLFEIE